MLKVLALLMFCTMSLLAQAAPAQAHAGHASQARSPSHASFAEPSIAASPDENDCPLHDGRCCKSVCAMCYLPMPSQHEDGVGIRRQSSALLVPRADFARLILLGRDPPVPRPRDF